MGFFLSILYLVTYYLTPVTIFGPLAAYRIQLIFAVLAVLVSVPALMRSFILKIPQSLALIGMGFAVVLSVLVGVRWPGGALQSFLNFIPNAFAFFLVCVHCTTKRRLQALVLVLLFLCMFVIGRGCIQELQGLPAISAVDPEADANSYVLAMGSDTGEWLYRLRGLGEIHDPNDFAQLVISVIPLVFIFWREKKALRNFMFVVMPVCVLLFGAYLTHSRSALLALLAMGIVAARRRIGTLPSLLLAGGLFAAALALDFTGGRGISASSGEDRTALWSQAMQTLKTHPLFGVGFGRLPEYTDLHLTAHNSLMVCAAELGLFGLYFWCLFLLPTMRDALTIASPANVGEGETVVPEEDDFPLETSRAEVLSKVEINHLGHLVVLSLTGFLVAGWFLSRAYVVTLFLLGGIAEVVFDMALKQGMVTPRLRLARVLIFAGILAVSLVIVMYIMLRVVNLTH